MKLPFKVQFRIAFRDVDMHGIVHHMAYLHYFEKGRVELLRKGGLTYNRVVEMGLGLVLSEAFVKYVAPVKYDDILDMNVGITKLGNTSFRISYEAKVDGTKVTEGHTVHVCLDLKSGKPKRVPDEIRECVSQFLVEEDD